MPFAFLIGNWKLIAIGLIALAVAGYVWSCHHAKEKYTTLVATLEAQAEAQRKEVERITAENITRKEKTDAETKRLRASLADASKRLRDSADAPILPAASPTADSPARICFDRAELSGSLSAFARGVASLVVEGDEARAAIDIARGWAQSPPR